MTTSAVKHLLPSRRNDMPLGRPGAPVIVTFDKALLSRYSPFILVLSVAVFPVCSVPAMRAFSEPLV